VKLRDDHNHNLGCADGLRLLRSTADTRALFHGWEGGDDGLTAAEAMTLHQEKLAAASDTLECLASGAENPSASTVYPWYRTWRQQHYGQLVDPLVKLGEKASMYLEQGVDVRTARSEDGSSWAVLVVTEIMRRTQQLAAASEIVFLDSTSSTDGTQSTTTVLLAATKAGAIPLAVLLHNCQTTESYSCAFRLLKDSYPLCFGKAHILYAESPEKLEVAIAELQAKSHQGYIQRVTTFLERKSEWVLLFRSDLTTRGHNTNNFAEASIRILKDIVLQRRRAYNVVALVPSGQVDGKTYEVCNDLGTCTCPAGKQGAFCKHQALVHHHYGGAFPNAPALTAHDRHQLGQLALGEKCPTAAFFQDFQEEPPEQPSTSAAIEEEGTAAVSEPDNGPTLGSELQATTHSCPSSDQQQYRQIQEQLWRHHAIAVDNPAYLGQLQHILSGMKKIHREPEVMACIIATKAVYAGGRRRGRTIKVQPTAIARRRPGITRGNKRVPAGRPSKGLPTKRVKREHSLALNIKRGVPSAKSHGMGH
ncbi:unnamed protein product, partial [Ixodes hexagonus]